MQRENPNAAGKIRITERFAPSFREDETGSLRKSVFLSVQLRFKCVVLAKELGQKIGIRLFAVHNDDGFAEDGIHVRVVASMVSRS